ncbi:MAG: MBL fold metallo-hydrolase [bacterium]|nr:MBL fold metallo-hydrolase [bacterium]
MADWTYRKGLHDVGDGVYAYLQPDGGWGWSNAGLIAAGGQSLLVDTLFDLKLTAEMLAEMRRASQAAAAIDTVVNTHANGDHCWGNQLVADAEIIASRRAAEEMHELPPGKMAKLMKAATTAARLGGPGRALGGVLGALGLGKARDLIAAGPFVDRVFGAFEFSGIDLVPPSRTFEQSLTLEIGGKTVELIEVGPAHTNGDAMVHVPEDRVLFAGDILFIEGHPILWEGPVANWVRALDLILEMDPEVIVPGHGPITDRRGVQRLKDYFVELEREARRRFEAGMGPVEAARDIHLEGFDAWGDAERLAVNVDTLYRELRGEPERTDVIELFARMAALA